MTAERILSRRRWRYYLQNLSKRTRLAVLVGASAAALSLPASFISWMNEPYDSEVRLANRDLQVLLEIAKTYPDISSEDQNLVLQENDMFFYNGRLARDMTLRNGCKILFAQYPKINENTVEDGKGISCDPLNDQIAIDMRSGT